MQTSFFKQNRLRISKQLGGGLGVFSAYTQLQRGNDAAFKFEQEANFWYLTGIDHPDWKVVIDGTAGSEWLIAPEMDEAHQLFDGSLGFEEASRISGIKKVISHDEGESLLRSLASRHSMVYTVDQPAYAEHFNFTLNPAIYANKQKLERVFASVRDCQKELAELRSIKQPEEIAAIKKAVKLTVEGFEHVKTKLDSYKYEYEIEADFSHHFRSHGAAGHAYDPIIASGKNACTLHYNQNSAAVRSGQLILMDVGSRVGGYAADITRTLAKGRPTKRQEVVFKAVQTAHERIVKLLEPDLAVEAYLAQVDDIMKEAMLELGLIRDMADEKYRQYFPHAVSHGLGIDVHDSLARPRAFRPGMVLTVEPGIYIPEENIGVRLEDDILITEKNHQNLSRQLSTGLS